MNPAWIDRLANWNPQFIRECRGRLNNRSLIVAIAFSAIAQIIILLTYNQIRQLTNQTPQEIWLSVFRTLTWIFPYFLFVSGSYLLTSDITNEERRGTLNFIRLSPRSSQSILLGKMLGVPILPYLSIALFVPLHLIAAMIGGVPFGFTISYYLLLGVGAFFLFSFALLVASFGNTQTMLGSQQSAAAFSFTALTFFFFTPLFITWNNVTSWSLFVDIDLLNPGRSWEYDLEWLYIPISSNIWLSHLFTLANLAIATFGIWQILRRRFYNPSGTILSKYQSYGLIAYAQILMFGFVVKTPNLIALFITEAIDFGLILLLISAITPKRQALLDWVRFDRRNVWDWVWSAKSPAPIAIAINLLIVNCIWIPWLLLAQFDNVALGLMSLLSQACTLLIYALIVQLILIQKSQRPASWATGAIATLLILPPIFLGLLSITPEKFPAIWIFFGYIWVLGVSLTSSNVSIGFAIAIFGQSIVIVSLGVMLRNKLDSLRIGPNSVPLVDRRSP